MRSAFLTLALVALASGVVAQTPPSPSKVAGYHGSHRAAHEGDVAAIRHLAAGGADLEARDRAGRTPTHVAAFSSQDRALRALAAAGADLNAREAQAYDVLTIGAVADDPAVVSLALALGNKPGLTTSPYDDTALIAAAHLGHHEVVRRLITGGAPLDHINNLGWAAVIMGDGGPDHVATVCALMAAGADATIPDRDGVTPQQHAVSRGYGAMVEIFQSTQE